MLFTIIELRYKYVVRSSSCIPMFCPTTVRGRPLPTLYPILNWTKLFRPREAHNFPVDGSRLLLSLIADRWDRVKKVSLADKHTLP